MNKNNINIVLIVLFLLPVNLLSQEKDNPFQTREKMTYNPAVIGSGNYNQFHFFHKSQWVGYKDSPQTDILLYEGSFTERTGLGSSIALDRLGPISHFNVSLAYAFHMPISDYTLSLGISGSLSRYSYSLSELSFVDETDKFSSEGTKNSSFIPSFIVGSILRYKSVTAGLSIDFRLKPDNDSGLEEGIFSGQNIYLFGEYDYWLSTNLKFKFNVYSLIDTDSYYKIESGVESELFNRYIVGFFFNNKNSLVSLAGFKYSNFKIEYSYDFITTNSLSKNSASHKLGLYYLFGNNNKISAAKLDLIKDLSE